VTGRAMRTHAVHVKLGQAANTDRVLCSASRAAVHATCAVKGGAPVHAVLDQRPQLEGQQGAWRAPCRVRVGVGHQYTLCQMSAHSMKDSRYAAAMSASAIGSRRLSME